MFIKDQTMYKWIAHYRLADSELSNCKKKFGQFTFHHTIFDFLSTIDFRLYVVYTWWFNPKRAIISKSDAKNKRGEYIATLLELLVLLILELYINQMHFKH